MTRAEKLQEQNRKIKYQIDSVRNTIIGKEKCGQDASFERKLLKSWSKYEGWEGAKEALASCSKALP